MRIITPPPPSQQKTVDKHTQNPLELEMNLWGLGGGPCEPHSTQIKKNISLRTWSTYCHISWLFDLVFFRHLRNINYMMF